MEEGKGKVEETIEKMVIGLREIENQSMTIMERSIVAMEEVKRKKKDGGKRNKQKINK